VRASNEHIPIVRVARARKIIRLHPFLVRSLRPASETDHRDAIHAVDGVSAAHVLFFGVDLSIGDQVLVVALCVLTSIGAAGVPGGSLPLLMIVMAQVGVPADGLALILGVDRLLDMGRTVVNVMGDVVCAAFIENSERKIEARAA
jgi:Na+/H+-dicarboxylate symporter